MKNNPLVSVIVCTRDRSEILEKYALKSLFKQNYPNYKIIVVDDSSKDNTLQMLKKHKDKIRVVKNNQSRGLCYVRNLGIKHAKGEIIAFIDDDCTADKNWIKELVKPFLKNPKLGVVGGKIFVGTTNKAYNNKKQIYGCNMSFRSKIFKKFLFDTNLYFNKCSFHDETELLYRLRNNKITMHYTEEAIVRHFKMPAEYRKNVKIGIRLNYIYMHSKKIPLINYYLQLFITILIGKRNLQKENEANGITAGFDSIRGLLSPKRSSLLKMPWIFYVLLLEIPIKAKLQNVKEEKIAKL